MFFMNYYCINSISVAFDSIPGYSTDTIGQTQIDSIFVPIIQVNHSGLNDTLEVQLTTVDSHGYPNTNAYVSDTLVIADAGNNYNIGAGNNYTINTIKWALANSNNPQIRGGRFAVNVTYHDSTKKDSCWFVYGYGSFTDTCPNKQPGTNYFANTSHFSSVKALPKAFIANSFALYNEYAGKGYLPDPTGDNIFFPCDTTEVLFHPGMDGANYIQDIAISANVLFLSYLGVPNIHTTDIAVGQNYPNPYKNTTTINYTLLKSGNISLKIADITGRNIFSQNYGTINPGQHTINIDAGTLSSGVYFYSIICSGYTVTKKMIVY